MKFSALVISMLAAASGMCADANANLSGTWELNVKKSHWGSKPEPVSVALFVEHNDPAIKYHGTITRTGENTRDFSFEGAIDGKEYPMNSSVGPGKVVFRRIDANTIESDFKSTDGTSTETARTSVSRDGKVLTRSIREKTPQGARSWTEVYDRH